MRMGNIIIVFASLASKWAVSYNGIFLLSDKARFWNFAGVHVKLTFGNSCSSVD